MFSLPDKGMYTMLFASIGLFLFVGFLFPTSPSRARTSRTSTEYSVKSSLKEIDFASANLKNNISQGYGRTQFAAVFGGLKDGRHNGIDIAASYGAEIHSQSEGKVVYIGDQDKYCPKKAYGKFVIVEDKDGDYTLLYAHLSKIKTAVGDKLKKGDVVGLVGTTGLATGPHLHFVVFKTSSLKIKNDETCGPKPEGADTNPVKYLGY